ncbi:hypothetical protein BASA61_001170 [Batrachochytrium salamandrivorans]|nr:hypothetical protein BASA61_001170 [Batrachochytrium salamandrivorans]
MVHLPQHIGSRSASTCTSDLSYSSSQVVFVTELFPVFLVMPQKQHPLPSEPFSIARSDCLWYTRFYCEENIYRLGCAFRESQPECCFEAVFISNEYKKIPLWAQANGPSNDEIPVVWDYHVILLQTTKADSTPPVTYVFDMDTVLEFPVAFSDYSEKALKTMSGIDLPKQYHRYYRVIPGELFLTHFASDRSHMLNADKGWNAEPPASLCISTKESTMNLGDYINMKSNTDSTIYGKVLNEAEFLDKYS